MLFRHYIFYLVLFFTFSCQGDDSILESHISSWTEDIPSQARELYQIRLAFGKSLAAALKEKELRDYIKQKSKMPDKQIFQELLYSLIKDDVLPSGKTIQRLIKQNEDEEVKALFGETLTDRVAEFDPMVTIKLPDLFYNYDWDTSDIIPFVGVMTPSLIDYCYVFYYYNGYSELIKEFEEGFFSNIKYFYVMLKYSTDYTLIDVDNMANEKNISLFELFPQFEYCSEDILDPIVKSGIQYNGESNKLILNKFNCFQIWKDLCSYKGEFAFDPSPCGLTIPCPRNCDPDNPLNKNLILSGFDVRNDLFILVNNLFNESANVSFDFFSNLKPNEYKRFVVPSVRYFDLDKFKVDISVNKRNTVFKNTKFVVPIVSTKYIPTQDHSKWISINAPMFDDVTNNDVSLYSVCVNLLFYSDLINPIEISTDYFYCLNPFYTGVIHSTSYRPIFHDLYSWCTNSDVIIDNFGIGITY